ncbi:MAG TPA: SpoIIE family protein phosphatase [Gemmataceae bacterium]|nr:SpoIIE family protein phosphatase [Gemmataceae bacterium]
MDYLEIVDGHGRRRRVGLDRSRLVIGREPGCDIHLPHPNVSRRHAQLQQNEQGRWVLQDLNSLNHIYADNRPVKQAVLEPGVPFRIAEYRLALHGAGEAESESTPPMTVEEPADAWTGLEPGWLEQLQVFQRGLLRFEAPRQVLEGLAAEFARIVQPQLVAVGLARPGGYRWEVVCDQAGAPAAQPCLAEADQHVGEDDSSVLTWGAAANGDAASPLPPLCLLFPIKGRSAVIGHVFVRRPRFAPLPAAIQRYLALLTSYAGLVWDTFQLAELRLAHKEMDQELRQARQIQIDLFPPTFDVDERLNAFGVNLPSVRVSGDYYDLFRTGPDTVAFVVADAMGHGMPAALMMAAVRASVRMGLAHGLPWDGVFSGLDEIISQARTGAFVTGVLGEVDLAARELRLVSAGHMPPSVVLDGRPVRAPEVCQTRPWGLPFPSPWQVGRVPLGDGDWSVVCFTDGITDAAARAERGFGARVVAGYHEQNYRLCAEDLCQGLLSEVCARQDPAAPLGDDQTVLVLRSGLKRE